MKTQNLLDEYYKFIDESEQSVEDIIVQAKQDKEKLIELNKEYENYIALSEDAKAETVYDEIEKLEKRVRMSGKKIETKRKITDKVIHDKTIELLKKQKEVPTLYMEESKVIQEQFEKAISIYNDAVEKANALNDAVEKELREYVHVFRERGYEEHAVYKATKREIGDGFTDNDLIIIGMQPIKINYIIDGNKNKIKVLGGK